MVPCLTPYTKSGSRAAPPLSSVAELVAAAVSSDVPAAAVSVDMIKCGAVQ